MPEGTVSLARRTATVLIAEDSPTQAAQLSFLLEERGFTVLAARDGKAAFGMTRQHRPDLVVSDVVMPTMDGYALCNAIKAEPELRNIPVILVTELSTPHDVFRGLDAGADNFIIKPYDESLLVSRINYLMTNQELRQSGKLQFGIEIELSGQRHFITAERQQILDLLISTYEQAVRLYDTLDSRQKALTQSYETLNALYHLADGLNHCRTPMDVGVHALERTLKLPGMRAGWIFLYDKGSFRLLASNGAPPGIFDATTVCTTCACQRRLVEGEMGAAVNVLECQRMAEGPNGTDLRFHASVPLISEGQPIGLLNLFGPEDGKFSEEQLQALVGAGNQIATALARALLHEGLEHKVAERTSELRAEVNERREAEGAARRAADVARQANQVLSAILDASPVGIVTVDRAGTVQTWNAAAQSIFGYAAAEIVGQPYPAAQDGGTPLAASLERLAEGEVIRNAQNIRQRKDGNKISLSKSAAPLLDHSGNFQGAVLVVEDVSERRQTEDQLRQAQKMEAIGNLTGGIAHDFNNMLTVVIGNLDLMSMMLKDNEQARDLAEAALSASLRGAELTRQLLAFSRRQPLAPEIVDANKLLRGMIKLLARTLGEQVEIIVLEGADLWPVLVDPAQLDSAIVNLAVNARDAMPGGGKLIFETRNQIVDEAYNRLRPEVSEGDYVIIEVTDTGTGMTAEVQSRIFEPFYTTKGVHKGTGLGLAMVYGFAKQSGGHINVYSELGHGTRFRLYLPRGRTAGSAADKDGDRAQTPMVRGGETVLVVEDNESVRQMVSRQIADLGYRVLNACDAAEGLATLERGEHIDLLFSDIVMPGEMNGIGLAKEATRRWPDLKVALTSGFSEEALNRNGGDSDFIILSKPYRQTDLARKLRQALDS